MGISSKEMGVNLDMTIAVDRDMKQQLITPFNHLTPVSDVGSGPTRETSQVLLAGVPSVFSRESSVFAPTTDWPVSYELK